MKKMILDSTMEEYKIEYEKKKKKDLHFLEEIWVLAKSSVKILGKIIQI